MRVNLTSAVLILIGIVVANTLAYIVMAANKP